MDAGVLVKILVFGTAGLIVLIFVLSGVHIVRAVYVHQRRTEERRLALRAARAVAQAQGDEVVITADIIKRDGFIIVQPDGLRDLALRIESADERAYKKMAEEALIEARAQDELRLSDSTCTNANACAVNQEDVTTTRDASAHSQSNDQSQSSSPHTPGTEQALGCMGQAESLGEPETPPCLSPQPVELSCPRDQTEASDQRLSVLNTAQADIESQTVPPLSRGSRMKQTLKRWFTSTDSFFD